MHNESDQALEFKNQGNEYFKKKDYTKAVECYTKAISKTNFHPKSNFSLDLNPIEPSYYANRAACYLSLKKYSYFMAILNIF